jgi:hypothetical protein
LFNFAGDSASTTRNFFSMGRPGSLAEGLKSYAKGDVISLHPDFISHFRVPNVVLIPIADKQATWDLFIVWQRGKTSGPLPALLDSLQVRSLKK